jgi:hypothetical protein
VAIDLTNFACPASRAEIGIRPKSLIEEPMPLHFTNQTIENLTVPIQATDSATRKTVVVKASYEALRHHGLQWVQEVAVAKYDSGEVESDGSIFVGINSGV